MGGRKNTRSGNENDVNTTTSGGLTLTEPICLSLAASLHQPEPWETVGLTLHRSQTFEGAAPAQSAELLMVLCEQMKSLLWGKRR